MAEERPDNHAGKPGSGPRDEGQGQGRRGGRHRGFRGRHGQKREGQPREGQPREGQPREGQPREGQPRANEQAPRQGQPRREDQGQRPREPRPPKNEEVAQQEPSQRPEAARDMPACPLCGKPVYDLSTAVAASRESGEPAHFDCVIERVQVSENLASGERLVYLGSGTFAVVVFKDRNESAFTVLRRVQWEKEGEKKEWRKSLSSRIANL